MRMVTMGNKELKIVTYVVIGVIGLVLFRACMDKRQATNRASERQERIKRARLDAIDFSTKLQSLNREHKKEIGGLIDNLDNAENTEDIKKAEEAILQSIHKGLGAKK